MAKSSILVKILGDSSSLVGEIGKSSTAVDKFKLGVLGAGAALGTAFVAGAVGLAKLGSNFDEQFDKIRVGTGATGDALGGLQEDFKSLLTSVPTDFASAGTAVADLNTRLGLTGDELVDLSGQFINLSRITGTDVSGSIDKATRVFGDWNVETDAQADTLDRLFRASQASGIGIDDLSGQLVSFGAPLRNLGFTLDESSALLAQFNKTGVNTETVVAGLKAGVGKLAKEGEPIPETFSRIVDEITKLGPGTDATGLAIELFGQRAGPDLADAIAGGKFEIEGMLAAITGGTDTINKAAKDTESFGEKWQLIKNRVFVGLQPLASRLFDALGDGLDRAGPLLDRVAVGFQVFRDAFQGGGNDADGTISAIRRFGLVAREVFDFLQETVPPIIDAVVVGFARIAAFVEQNWPQISATITTALKAVQSVVTSVVDIVTVLWETFGDTILSVIATVAKAIVPLIEGALKVVAGVFEVFAGLVTGDWGRLWEGVKSILSGAVQIITTAVRTTFNALRTIITAALDGAVAVVLRLGGDIVAWFVSLPGKIMDALSGLAGQLRTVGSDIIDGLWSGLKSKWDDVVGWFGGIADKVPGFLKGPLGISSPSKVFIEIGQDIMGGLTVGLDRGFQTTQAELESAASAIRAPFDVGTTNVSTVGDTVINVHGDGRGWVEHMNEYLLVRGALA